MHPRLWFEYRLRDDQLPLLGDAVVAGNGAGADPFDGVDRADGIVAGAGRYDAAFLDRAPRARVIARHGAGYDNVDVAEATRRGIIVCFTPDGPVEAAAEQTFALLLSAARKLGPAAEALRKGEWRDRILRFEGTQLSGRTIGLVGLGRIGGRVARVALAFGMRVIAFDPLVMRPEPDVRMVANLQQLLADADVVSLHLPATPATHHLIGANELEQMRKGAILINCARGGLVDEAALIRAIDSGHIGAAGLDVFEREPPPSDYPLLQRENVVVTPHLGGVTDTARREMLRDSINQAIEVLRGTRPAHALNWEEIHGAR